ncbi:MAG: efflux transporter permease subunit [Caulobacteraceae bacterium]|nr:efflux transporter permease subunit [Caulobacteraceae bacterium]
MNAARELRISAWAIRNPIPVTVVFVAAVVAGSLTFFGLPIKNYPNIDFPIVKISITRSGAAPSEMESQVTRPLENALAGMSNVDSIFSNVSQGASLTQVEFALGEDPQKVADDVRSKVDQIRNDLPRDIDPPVIERREFDDQSIMTYAVAAPGMSASQLSWFIDNTLARALQAAPGVGQIKRIGGVDREINVLIDPVRLAANGLTANAVNAAISKSSLDAPGGRMSVGGREQTLRVLGAAVTVDQIRALSIPTADGRFVRLADVADVGDGAAEPRGFALLNGRPVVGFRVFKTQNSSEVTAEDSVNAAIDALEKVHPGLRVHKIVSQVDRTRGSYLATLHTLLEGVALAALVVWLFLRDWRATAITAIAMPVSLIPTFAVMGLAGFSLNTVTLLGLTLVIGILVDDAIVEIENIEKRVHAGARPFDAAMDGADQIGLAVVATTFAIVAVFLPVGFMPGISGRFFREFGVTVSVAVLFSLAVARLLTPLLAAHFLKPQSARERPALPRPYAVALGWALDHRGVALAGGALVFIVSAACFLPLQKGLLPEGDPNYMYIDIEGPPGATLSDMRTTLSRLDALLERQPETAAVFADVGGQGVGSGYVVEVLKPHRRASVRDLRDRLRPLLRQIPDTRLTFDVGGLGSAGVQVILTSESGDGLDAAALALERQMRGVPGIADPRLATPPSAPELVVRPRPDEAARLGVSAVALAAATRIATLGEIDANVAKLDEGERRIPIRVRLPERERADLAVIRDLRLPTASGALTTVGAVADVSFQAGPAYITRFARKRNLIVIADTTGNTQIGDAQARVNALPTIRHLPPGVGLAAQGQEQASAELYSGFVIAIVSAVGLVYAVMVLLFRSFFKPLVILAALPTAIGGAFVALLLTDQPLAIPSLTGFLMLMGLAAKNSILLVEYAIERERAGATQRAALLEACRERARPIVMTSFAMMAGMFPTALSLGTGSEFRQPMAVAVIGGLITSTALSLVLIPVVYEFIDDFERWVTPWLSRLVTPRAAPGLSTAAEMEEGWESGSRRSRRRQQV